jgi:hypothetical protein
MEEEFALLWSTKGAIDYTAAEGMIGHERKWWLERIATQLKRENDELEAARRRR